LAYATQMEATATIGSPENQKLMAQGKILGLQNVGLMNTSANGKAGTPGSPTGCPSKVHHEPLAELP